MRIFEGLQEPIPVNLSYWYEKRASRLVLVSHDQRYECTNTNAVPDHKLAAFEEGARWTEVRMAGRRCRCRIVGEPEAARIIDKLKYA